MAPFSSARATICMRDMSSRCIDSESDMEELSVQRGTLLGHRVHQEERQDASDNSAAHR
jgi:hypothetical protein